MSAARRSERRALLRGALVAAIAVNPVAQLLDPTMLARLDDPGYDPTLDELGIDSLSALALAIDIGERLGVTLTEEELRGGARLSELVEFLASA
jgi:hypothetical protein